MKARIIRYKGKEYEYLEEYDEYQNMEDMTYLSKEIVNSGEVEEFVNTKEIKRIASGKELNEKELVHILNEIIYRVNWLSRKFGNGS